MEDEKDRKRNRLIDAVLQLCRQLTALDETETESIASPLAGARASHHQYTDIIEFLPDATFVINRERKVIAWNRAIEEMTGVSKKDILGKGNFVYAIPFYGEPRPIIIDLVLGVSPEYENQYSYVKKQGDTCYAEVFAPKMYGGKGAYLWGKASPLYDHMGMLAGAIESIRDMTDQKLASEALKKSEERYRELVQNANSIILRIDTEGRVTFFNEFAQAFLGYRAEEILGRSVIGTIFPERDSCGNDLVGTVRDFLRYPEQYPSNESENICRDGSRVYVTWTIKGLYDGNGRLTELLCVGNDATARRSVEKSLQKSEYQFRTLVETMDEGLKVQDEDGVIVYANDKLCHLLGYSRDELIGMPEVALLDAANLSIRNREIARRLESECSSYEIELTAKDGHKIPVLASGSPVIDENLKFRGTISTVTDITILKLAEKKLRESEEKYRMIFENSPLGIYHFDSDGAITAANENIYRIWGTTREKLIGFNLLTSLKNKKMKAAVTICLSGGSAFYEGNYLSVTGGKITNLKADYGPILSEDGKVLGGIGIIEDISDRKRTEEALQESEKQLHFLSGQLLSAQEQERKRIARELHDSIGSSLSAVKFGLEAGLKSMRKGTSKYESLNNLITLAQHAIDESRRIMTDLRPSILDDLGIITTIKWFCGQFRKVYESIHIEENLSIEEEDIPEPLKIVIFRVMQEAFHNIAKHSGADLVTLALRKTGRTIELRISDNGVGFDPGSVLSLSEERNGLGLPSMKERAELSGGSFALESGTGKGSTILASWAC